MMFCSLRLAFRSLLIGLVATVTLVANGAELRTVVQGRMVVRQVSYQQPTPAEPLPRGEAIELEVQPEEYAPGEVDMFDLDSAQPYGSPVGEPHIYLPVVNGWTYWGKFEFLLAWHRGQDMPPLVTTSPAGTPIGQAGVLGQSGTQVLYGGDRLDQGAQVGGRVTFGTWFGHRQLTGVGVRFFALGESSNGFSASSDTTPILARPFFDIGLDLPNSDVVAYPGETTGAISVDNTSRVTGGDAFLRRVFYTDHCHRIDLLVGYQATNIDQDLRIDSTRTVVRDGGSIPFGTVVDSYDLFATKNQYNAVALGLIGEYDRGPMTFGVLAKVGLGTMDQTVRIDGGTETRVPGQPISGLSQGLLARDTNIGEYTRSVFSVSPEITLNAAYHLNDCIDLTVGYWFILWNRVAQPGSQIDMGIDTGLANAPTRPAFTFEDSNYFLQGLTFGLQWVY